MIGERLLLCSLRLNTGLKLPDAIIAGTAIQNECQVVSADAHFQRTMDSLRVLSYTPNRL